MTKNAYSKGKLILVGAIDVVGPPRFNAVPIDSLVDIAWDEVGERLLGVAVDWPEVQHHGPYISIYLKTSWTPEQSS